MYIDKITGRVDPFEGRVSVEQPPQEVVAGVQSLAVGASVEVIPIRPESPDQPEPDQAA